MEHVYCCTGHELKIPNIVNSQGVYLFDDTGKRFMDLESGVWCTCLGHKNERINGAITSQIDRLMHAGFCYSNEIVEESSKSILEIVNFIHGKCVFLCSGSEAIEISRQMAKHLTEKSLSLTLHDSYLGAYSSITDKTRNWYLLNWEKCKSCPDKETCNLSCDVIQKIPEDVSEFIFEPGSASGFVRFPPNALIGNIVKTVRSNGGKIIANEVTTGVGRTGTWFGYQHYDIIPDFIAVGKGIGNGYPVSIALINESTARQLKRKPFHYSQSHQNDPLGAAVVQAVLREIESNNLITEAERKGSLFSGQLKSLVDKSTVLDVRGRGMMFAIDMANTDAVNRIYTDLINMGYILGNRGTYFRIDPPLVITEAEFDRFFNVFKTVVGRQKNMT